MKQLFTFLSLLLINLNLWAQPPASMQGGAPPAIGHLYGKIVDDAGKSIPEASILILESKINMQTQKATEVLLKGTTTKGNGEFSFDKLPIISKLTLKVSAVGYEDYEQEIAPLGKDYDKDLGNITMVAAPKELETVVVTATRPLVKMDMDKKVFNVDKNIVTAGGTAVDVMRNVPSIQVDIDGNIKLRNAAPQLFIDGRPTTLTLEQIPADAIESVEVITNPSAKYDASGGNAGILNIVLKKNKKSGYNGNVMAGIDRRGGWNAGGNINLRQDKFNFSASIMTNQMRNKAIGSVDRYNLGDPAVNLYQDNLNKTKGGFIFGKVGVDYFVTNRTTLSASVIRVHGKFKPDELLNMQTDSITSHFTNSNFSNRHSLSSREFNALGFQGGIKHNLKKPGEEWTIDFNIFNGKNEGHGLFTTNYLSGQNGTVTGTQLQRNTSNGKNNFITIQSDYVKPFGENSKLETGLRAQISNLTSNIENSIKYPGSPDYIALNAATNNYKNTNNVYAAYASVSSKIGENFGYNIGLRAESSNYNGTITTTNQKFGNKYPVSLFPSLFLTQKLTENQELQFSVTRRINRPNFFQLIPFTDYTDSLNITRGNPDLIPEFTYTGELGYSNTYGGSNTFMASAYYKYTTDLITRYYDTGVNEITGKTDYISTYINANSAQSYGLELTSVNRISKWWELTGNINLYNSKINTNNITATSQDPMWSVFGKVNSNFTLPNNFSIQLSADYQSKTNLPVNNTQQMGGPPMGAALSASQGYINAFYGVDMAIKKSFLKGNAASATLSVNDIFRTRRSNQFSQGIGFEQYYNRLNNPQMVRLTLTYRFGKVDMSLFKRQNMRSQQEGMQNGLQGLQ